MISEEFQNAVGTREIARKNHFITSLFYNADFQWILEKRIINVDIIQSLSLSVVLVKRLAQ